METQGRSTGAIKLTLKIPAVSSKVSKKTFVSRKGLPLLSCKIINLI